MSHDHHDLGESIRAYVRAFDDRDIATCLGFFGDGATIDFMRRFTGQAAIEKWHRQRFENGVQIVKVDAIDVAGETVTVDATVTSKLLKLGFRLHGQAILRFSQGKIEEMSFERPHFSR